MTANEIVEFAEKRRDEEAEAGDWSAVQYWVGYIDGAKRMMHEAADLLEQQQAEIEKMQELNKLKEGALESMASDITKIRLSHIWQKGEIEQLKGNDASAASSNHESIHEREAYKAMLKGMLE